MMRAFIIAVLVLCAAAPARAGGEAPLLLGPRETACLRQALSRLNMSERDAAFEKDVAKPVLALQWVRDTLQNPLSLPGTAERILEAADSAEGDGFWPLTAALLETGSASDARDVPDESLACSNAVNPHLAGYLREFYDHAIKAASLLEDACAGLAVTDKEYAAASVFGETFNAEDRPETRAALIAAGVSSGAVDRAIAEGQGIDPEPGQKRLADMARRFKLGQALAAGRLLHEATKRLRRQSALVSDWPKQRVVIGTRLGPIIVGTAGDDIHTEAALLILDPGGSDRYGGEAGVANALRGQAIAAIVDLGGADRYSGAGLLGPGAALFGLADTVDVAGNDTYDVPCAGQGAAFFGVAWVEDSAGDDFYRAGGLAQAAAVCGLGVLRDAEGNDVYRVGLAGQAYAGMLGAAFLADGGGNDAYFAGGVEPDWERNEDRYLSLAQGFSIGLRPFVGGGVAALVDAAGNDTYVADVYGQGCSYWYSAGFLLDKAGNDTYRMHQYGQGSGIHLSLGLLADFAGNDQYDGWGLMQGNAHDYAVGMLFDKSGNDTYTADSSAQGRAINNSVALLVDSRGDDAYFGRNNAECQGIGNDGGPRRYGSLSILMDLDGTDGYSCGATNGGMMLRPSFGIVYDAPNTPQGTEVKP